MLKKISLFMSLLMLAGCSSPKSYLEAEIEGVGYIPYPAPVSYAGVGTMVSGNGKTVSPLVPPDYCFPEGYGLRFVQDAELGDVYKNVELDFNAETNEAINIGNTVLSLKLGASFVRSVKLEFGKAEFEQLNMLALKRFYRTVGSGAAFEDCRDLIEKRDDGVGEVGTAFVSSALKVEDMKFEFYSQTGALIDLEARLHEVVDISAGVGFEIENRYSLIIKSPKYIGYQLARRPQTDSGQVEYFEYANSVDSQGNWKFGVRPAFMSLLSGVAKR